MKHYGTKRLETKRLILRRLAASDAEAMFRNWASDPEVTRFLSWPATTIWRFMVRQRRTLQITSTTSGFR